MSEERAQLADLLFQVLEPSHLAAETDHLLDELRDVAFRAIQPVELFFDVPLGARTVCCSVNMSISITSTAEALRLELAPLRANMLSAQPHRMLKCHGLVL